MVVRRKYFTPRTPVFELNGWVCEPTRWGTWAFLLDFSQEPLPTQNLDDISDEEVYLGLMKWNLHLPEEGLNGIKDFLTTTEMKFITKKIL